ncbi:DUF4142 domain-containing protein [Myxococcus sp. K38C18041901]|uniref:DUF4142 domain-containing protein n=1 Tax=Myxococcus guangdongensis TaxID=2906760 RepID=UPI0020A7B3E7|nr:DUF4142 domain-containing protein [Myxococcus guangdongensis]MCP3059457.1 DUF4142 domain-containing protein [Myxococcus guangdongensis]
MKRTLSGIALAVSLFTGGAALAQSGASATPSSTMKPTTPQKGMAEYRGFMAPTDEKALLERLHYANQQEIQAGQLAQKNSQNAEVRSFGEMMVKDHTAMDQKLMAYAKGKGMTLTDMPKAMNDVEKKMMAQDKATGEALAVLQGMPFDSCYMAAQVAGHDAVLGKVLAAKQGMPSASPELTAMFTELIQKVPAHREQAWQILGKLDDGMGVGGSGTSHTGMPGNKDHAGHGEMGTKKN